MVKTTKRPYRKTKFNLVGINPTDDKNEGTLINSAIRKAKRLYREGITQGDFYAYHEIDIVFYFTTMTISCDFVAPGIGKIGHKSLKS